MAETCPACGASLPPVRDAFCSECFHALDESPEERAEHPPSPEALDLRLPEYQELEARNPLKDFSIPARVVIVCCAVGGLVVVGLAVSVFRNSQPGGLPIRMILVAVLALVTVVGGITLRVLQAMGVPIDRQDEEALQCQDPEDNEELGE